MGHGRDIVLAVAVAGALVVAAPVIALAAKAPEGDYGDAAGRAEGSNPSLGGKLIGYADRLAREGAPPDVVILGTSRGMQLDPREVRRVSGRSAYNLSVSDGAARELLAFADFVELASPGDPPHLVIMFDVEAVDRRTPTRRVTSVLASERAARSSCGDREECAEEWARAVDAIVAGAKQGQRAAKRPPLSTFQDDNGLVQGLSLARIEREGGDLGAVRDRRIGLRIESYRPGSGFDRLMPIPMAAVERAVTLANGRGDRPTFVITPMHPDCIRRCGEAGWSERRRDVLAFLRGLGEEHELDVHDLTEPASFGGSAASFYDEIHIRPEAAAQVVAELDELGAWDVGVSAPERGSGVPETPRANDGFLAAWFALVRERTGVTAD